MRYPLPKEERRLLEVAYRAALNKRIANKINTIVLFDKGLKASEISNLLIREDNTLDKNSTLSLLKMIEEHNQTADKIALIVDNARYYYNKDVKNYIENSDKLEMIYLPPYSPNLNLIERVWKFMKTKVIRNQHYDTFLDFKKALGDFFQNFPDYFQELDNLLVEEFQTFPVK